MVSRCQEARPFFCTVPTIRDARPRAVALENVAGLERRSITAAGARMTCLAFILEHIGEQVPNYYACVVPLQRRRPFPSAVSSADHGSIYYWSIVMCTTLLQRTCFENEPWHCGRIFFRRARAVRPAVSFAEGLSSGAQVGPSAFHTRGCFPRHSCELHRCGCGSRTCECGWRGVHHKAWQCVADCPEGQPYFKYMWEVMGIDAARELGSNNHRKRDLLNLTFATKGLQVCLPNGVLDLSQSFSFKQFRSDGILPTLATSSELYAFGLGRRLHPAELFPLMGFPPTYNLEGYSRSRLAFLLGNTMHVGVVGVAAGVLLALRQC